MTSNEVEPDQVEVDHDTADDTDLEDEVEHEDYVVVVEVTHDNGVVIQEVRAESAADALDGVLTRIFGDDYEPGSGYHRHTRQSIVVRGEVC